MDNELSVVVGQRINTLLKRRGVRQKDLARELDIPDNTISYFVSGNRIPNTFQIVAIADFFHVSTDYLLGLSDAETNDYGTQYVCDATGLSVQTVSELLCLEEKSTKIIERMVNVLMEVEDEYD